ncbi:sugar O-acetyltransferase [Lactobacillus sp. DCY120]|uniref:Acetyltransferase n=1 Tax=Bombilactobacillus apium TaxID=2675299 RepID=A0A850RCJ2_9LACO|nr:sugar O-acetyltransferase [Bombilactobacillus apium]NVY96488.1 sugar O-acetyltransferase [Bombilactobacillus apium]
MSPDHDYQNLLAGKLYRAHNIQPEHRSTSGKVLVQKINQLPRKQIDQIKTLERQLFASCGTDVFIQPPFEVDYGRHISIGDHFYCNSNAILLDTNEIRIGNNVMIGPRVNLFTAGHPVDALIRNQEWEFAQAITISDNVWLGGNVTVLPGVTIGAGTVVGAGSVVTKDLPADVIAVGNPARILRSITAEDHAFWQAKFASQ